MHPWLREEAPSPNLPASEDGTGKAMAAQAVRDLQSGDAGADDRGVGLHPPIEAGIGRALEVEQ